MVYGSRGLGCGTGAFGIGLWGISYCKYDQESPNRVGTCSGFYIRSSFVSLQGLSALGCMALGL